ncbi:MAG: terpene cyclase/mutase family protein [Planctomycetes bacterium]|nr:terpene cyclase/mutase family protein [Planctomycetota bacterium]
MDRGIDSLRKTQAEDGSWSEDRSPGVTGIALTGLLRTGKVTPDDPMAKKAIQYILSLVNPEKHHIAGKAPVIQLQNYVTSVNVMALVAANRDEYKKVIGDATEFLKQLQWDEGEGVQPKDPEKGAYYGGFGYDSHNRPDLSNTQFALDALVAAGIPSDDPALKKAQVFVSRCQNLKGEGNDQPWADKINDGGFIYTPAAGGQSKVGGDPQTGLPSYGSMTYAGVKSMIYAGVNKDDPRVKAGYEWIKKHYTVEANPGMPKTQQGLYYYYHTMAKCLSAMDVDYVVDSQGVKHDWRADITQALAKRQRPDGSWKNDADQWMEGDANLVTGYALLALSYCKPKTAQP